MAKPRYALITGANGGIGRALCSAFSAEGYNVIGLDVHAIMHDALTCTHYLSVDLEKFVQDEHFARDCILRISALLPSKQLHCLVNNAAVQILGGIDKLTRNDWESTLAVNLEAPFLLTQAFLSQMELAHGCVINVSSIHAKLTKRNFVAYATSKAALTGLTKALAVDVGNRIRVNSIAPAAIETEMLLAGFANNPAGYESLKNYHPVKRIGYPEEIAKMAIFIANDIGFIHGSCFEVNGGIGVTLHDPD